MYSFSDTYVQLLHSSVPSSFLHFQSHYAAQFNSISGQINFRILSISGFSYNLHNTEYDYLLRLFDRSLLSFPRSSCINMTSPLINISLLLLLAFNPLPFITNLLLYDSFSDSFSSFCYFILIWITPMYTSQLIAPLYIQDIKQH